MSQNIDLVVGVCQSCELGDGFKCVVEEIVTTDLTVENNSSRVALVHQELNTVYTRSSKEEFMVEYKQAWRAPGIRSAHWPCSAAND